MTTFDDMAKAMREREIALNGLNRWQLKLNAAELRVEELAKSFSSVGQTAATEPTFVQPSTNGTEPAPLPADYAETAQ